MLFKIHYYMYWMHSTVVYIFQNYYIISIIVHSNRYLIFSHSTFLIHTKSVISTDSPSFFFHYVIFSKLIS